MAQFPKTICQLERIFQSLNVIFCELTSLLVLNSWSNSNKHSQNNGHISRQGYGPPLSMASLSVQTEAVSEFVIRLLKGEAVTSQLGRPLSPAAYVALLPTIWSLLNSPAAQEQDKTASVLQVVVEHAMKTSSTSALKRPTTEFLARVVLVSSLNCLTCLAINRFAA
jgi:pre-rRNA-processing protein IPI1